MSGTQRHLCFGQTRLSQSLKYFGIVKLETLVPLSVLFPDIKSPLFPLFGFGSRASSQPRIWSEFTRQGKRFLKGSSRRDSLISPVVGSPVPRVFLEANVLTPPPPPRVYMYTPSIRDLPLGDNTPSRSGPGCFASSSATSRVYIDSSLGDFRFVSSSSTSRVYI